MEDIATASTGAKMTYGPAEHYANEYLKVNISLLDIKSIPSTTLKFYSVDELPLVKYELWNKTAETLEVRLECEIVALSEQRKNQASLKPNSYTIHYQLPLPIVERVEALDSDRDLQIHISISYEKDGNWHQAYDATPFDITILHRNTLRLYTANPEGGYIPLFKHLVGWVTLDEENVQTWVGRADSNARLVGYPDTFDPAVSRKQVRAIDRALREHNIRKSGDSSFAINLSRDNFDQWVRRPKESLKGGVTNCLDGAVLYAILIEKAGLDPVILIQRRHALVGWKTFKGKEWKNLPDKEKYEFFDTTKPLIDSADPSLDAFEQICKETTKKYQQLLEEGWFEHETFDKNEFAYRLDVKQARKELARKQRHRYKYEEVPLFVDKHDNAKQQERVPSLQDKHNGTVQTVEPPNSNAVHTEEPAPPPESPNKEQQVEPSLYGIGQRRAVVVGVNNFKAREQYGLQLCADDAEMFYQQLLVSSFAPERLHVLTNRAFEKPEGNNILSHLHALADDSVENDLLLFYYSGALRREGQNYYFVTMYGSKLPLSEVKKVLLKARAGAKVAMLDISNAELLASKRDSEQSIAKYMQSVLEHFEGISVLASYKVKSAKLNASQFTHYLVKSLAQQARETSQDFITLQDVYQSLTADKVKLYPPQPENAAHIILCHPSREKREYFRMAYRYVIGVQQVLKHIHPKIHSSMGESDCKFAIDALNSVGEPVLPATDHSSREERKVGDRLYDLGLLVTNLKRDVDDFWSALALHALAAQIKPQDILAKLMDALQSAEKIASDLRVTIMPGETGTNQAKS